MVKKSSKSNGFFAIMIVCMMLSAAVIPVTLATNTDRIKGFDKGPSYKPVVPMKKVTFVNFDENSYLDDYAYLAAVPTSVFESNGKLYSNPLLFYQDEYNYEEDKERTLNSRQGLSYFMDDWMSYCNNKLDQMTLINVPKNKIDSDWNAKEYTLIEDINPYDIASKLVLSEWSYSDNAVIAVIEENFEKPDKVFEGEIGESFPVSKVGHKQLQMDRPTVGIGGNYESFEINDESYKYLVVKAEWGDPSFDVDMQIYDDQLGMVSSNAKPSWKQGKAVETGGSYIHDYGTWEIGLTAFPKKSPPVGKMKSMYQSSTLQKTGLLSKLRKDVVNVDLMLYPGIVVEIDALPPFGCRDATFKLSWNNPSINLGLTVLDPAGTEIASSLSSEQIINGEIENNNNTAEVKIASLGECRNGEHYSVCVYALDDVSSSFDFTIDYSWEQNFSKIEGDCLTSAINGAVLASSLNAPLLYTNTSTLSDCTKKVLQVLGVKNIYLVNLGGHLDKKVKNEINNVANIKHDYQESFDVYTAIRQITRGDDIVFTTIEPWAYWYATELKPADENKMEKACFIGPAAYIAAQHGTPVIVVDIHPELSQAVVYHKDFWIKNAEFRTEPSAGDMILSGEQVYRFLDDIGFDKKGNTREEGMETIITVAGQFNIGPTWDRTFVGKALAGRFHFSPVDTSYWICRNVFYPSMILVNPGMEKVTLWQGSQSRVEKIGGRVKNPLGVNLHIYKPTQKEEFTYPVLQTYVSMAYKFNEQASNHWGTMYTRADGITPYVTPSPDAIDVGATDKTGAYYPDLDDSNVVPFYSKKAGYSNCFSTNFEKVVENLNQGVIMWVQDAHGYHYGGGTLTFWNPDSPYIYEENPWRAYEPVMLKLGHLRTLLHWMFFMYSEYGGMKQLEKLADTKLVKFQFFSEVGSTDNPDVALYNPSLAGINRIINKVLGLEILGAFHYKIHWSRLFNNPGKLPIVTTYDGMVTTSTQSGAQIIEDPVGGYEFDDALDNLHSCGINTVVCLPAGTYLQMAWIRHGSVYQIMDPWSTSDYCAVWLQSIIKNLAKGDTIGQAYEKGVRASGPEYLVNHWWWDTAENVCFYGDPDLRVFVPGTEYSDANYWEWKDVEPLGYDKDVSIDGHMPYGATDYPHEKTTDIWQQYSLIIMSAVIVVVLVGIVLFSSRRKRRRKKK